MMTMTMMIKDNDHDVIDVVETVDVNGDDDDIGNSDNELLLLWMKMMADDDEVTAAGDDDENESKMWSVERRGTERLPWEESESDQMSRKPFTQLTQTKQPPLLPTPPHSHPTPLQSINLRQETQRPKRKHQNVCPFDRLQYNRPFILVHQDF